MGSTASRPPGSRRRPSVTHRARRRLVALVPVTAAGVVAVVAATASGAAHSATADQPVAVAAALGVHAPAPSTTQVADRLALLAASRAQRTEAAAAAVAAQAAADQAAEQRAAEAAANRAVLPVPPGTRYTSTFGMRWGVLHAGIDLAAPMGTPEYAAMDGVVLRAGPASGFGQAIWIQHTDGDVTVYGHMEKILVAAGDHVTAGQTIALMGAEGEATGPHLHFEVHLGGIDGEKVDPAPWLAAHGVQLPPLTG